MMRGGEHPAVVAFRQKMEQDEVLKRFINNVAHRRISECLDQREVRDASVSMSGIGEGIDGSLVEWLDL